MNVAKADARTARVEVRGSRDVSERGPMSRTLVLIAAILLFREFLPRRSRKSPTAISPYMNSLDGLLSGQQISLVMDELRARESPLISQPSSKHPPPPAT